ncbi:unnamed protein product [Gordionus sp. m RMFG-2023]
MIKHNQRVFSKNYNNTHKNWDNVKTVLIFNINNVSLSRTHKLILLSGALVFLYLFVIASVAIGRFLSLEPTERLMLFLILVNGRASDKRLKGIEQKNKNEIKTYWLKNLPKKFQEKWKILTASSENGDSLNDHFIIKDDLSQPDNIQPEEYVQEEISDEWSSEVKILTKHNRTKRRRKRLSKYIDVNKLASLLLNLKSHTIGLIYNTTSSSSVMGKPQIPPNHRSNKDAISIKISGNNKTEIREVDNSLNYEIVKKPMSAAEKSKDISDTSKMIDLKKTLCQLKVLLDDSKAPYNAIYCSNGKWDNHYTPENFPNNITAVIFANISNLTTQDYSFSKYCRTITNVSHIDINLEWRDLSYRPFMCENINETALKHVSSLRLMCAKLIEQNHLMKFPHLETLTFNNGNPSSLKYGELNYCRKLTHIDYSQNTIAIIYASAFNHMESLETLNLSNNRIRTIYSSAFKELPKLWSIDLRFNRLTYLFPGTFTRLESLKKLILDRNYFVQLDFTVVPRDLSATLEALSFFGNDILTAPALVYLNKLNLLDIRNKLIKTDLILPCNIDNLKSNMTIKSNLPLCGCGISPLKVWYKSKLDSIYLKCSDSRNHSIFIQELENDKCHCNHPINMTLTEFSKFCKFIGNNKIMSINQIIKLQNVSSIANYSLFCANLDYPTMEKYLALHVYDKWINRSNRVLRAFSFYNIYLSSNEYLIQNIFPINISNKSNFYYPKSIKFVNCDLSDTTKVSYPFFGKLLHLDLSYNVIKVLQSRSFSALPYLLTLNLSSNQIQNLRNWDFSNITALSRLYLHANMIVSIQANTFVSLTNLIELTLHSNRLKTIDDTDLPISIKILYLHDNFLTSVSQKFLSRDFNILTFSGNPIKCNCYYKEYKQYTFSTNYAKIDFENFLTEESSYNSLEINELIKETVCILDSIQFLLLHWNCIEVHNDDEYLSSTNATDINMGTIITSLSPEDSSMLARKAELKKRKRLITVILPVLIILLFIFIILIFAIVWSVRNRSALKQRQSLIAEVKRASEEEKKQAGAKPLYDAYKRGGSKYPMNDELYYPVESALYTSKECEGGVYSSNTDPSTDKRSSTKTGIEKSLSHDENIDDTIDDLGDPSQPYYLSRLLDLKDRFNYADFMGQDDVQIEKFFSDSKNERK